MELFNAEQIRKWDQFTITHEPIASLDLMERAATKCVEWLVKHRLVRHSVKIFCGKGNNGGDGVVIARLLLNRGVRVEVFILEFGKPGSIDFQTNLQRLHELPADINFIQNTNSFPALQEEDVVIDALFGSGLNKPLEGLAKEVVEHINRGKALVVSIDVPSGMFIDQSSKGNAVVVADHTLTFQIPKLAFLEAENAAFTGLAHVLDIGLHPGFLELESSDAHLVDLELIRKIYKPRSAFAHKGAYGHALLVGGSYGKMGALVLATEACLRTGAGLTTAFAPSCGYPILQTALPEAMVLTDADEGIISSLPTELERFNAIGIGPGLGTEETTQKAVADLIASSKRPLVIDADGLNCLSKNQQLLKQLPPDSILTPHPKEFERLFGTCANDFERINAARKQAKLLNIIIVLKGHHTLVATPHGQLYFNSTGNAGMAKGGSGDVLTGVITALVAQGYEPLHAALLGVYLHGLAGDLAAQELSMEAMLARDIIHKLGAAFLQVGKLS